MLLLRNHPLQIIRWSDASGTGLFMLNLVKENILRINMTKLETSLSFFLCQVLLRPVQRFKKTSGTCKNTYYLSDWHRLLFHILPENKRWNDQILWSDLLSLLLHRGVISCEMAFNFSYTEWYLMKSMFWDKSISHIAKYVLNIIKTPLYVVF